MMYVSCNPLPLGVLPFPIMGETVALILLTLLLVLLAGIALDADTDFLVGDVHAVRTKIRTAVQGCARWLAAVWRQARVCASSCLHLIEARDYLEFARRLEMWKSH